MCLFHFFLTLSITYFVLANFFLVHHYNLHNLNLCLFCNNGTVQHHYNFQFIADEDSFWYFEIFVLIFKLTLTGLFCIIARDSPFQTVLAFFVCALYAMLLLRHTPYLVESADLLALTTSFVLALTLLAGYVLTATKAFLNHPGQEKELEASTAAMDTFLIVINSFPFAIFLWNCVKRAVHKAKSRGETKIIPVQNQELSIQQRAQESWMIQ